MPDGLSVREGAQEFVILRANMVLSFHSEGTVSELILKQETNDAAYYR